MLEDTFLDTSSTGSLVFRPACPPASTEPGSPNGLPDDSYERRGGLKYLIRPISAAAAVGSFFSHVCLYQRVRLLRLNRVPPTAYPMTLYERRGGLKCLIRPISAAAAVVSFFLVSVFPSWSFQQSK